MLDLTFKQVSPNVYVKWNELLGIRTTIHFDGPKIHVKHEQRVDVILDANAEQANSFTGYKGKEMVQATRIPVIEHRKIMQRCGFKPGQGYDEKKFKQIVNDRDNYKFKTVPGRI